MNTNPLQRFFRRPALWVKLPTGGKWYSDSDITMNETGEIEIYGLTAVDDVMLNTPDALLNGQALEQVIKSCAPAIKNVKSMVQPDLEAVYLAIKSATNDGKYTLDRKCPKCNHENTFELNCNAILDNMTYVEDSDCVVNIDNQLLIYIKPYDYEMRSLMLQRQFEEQRTLTQLEKETTDLDEFKRAELLAQSVEKLTRLTFDLVAGTITTIEILGAERTRVTDKVQIAEWLSNVPKATAEAVISAVNDLNMVGPPKSTAAVCESCNHSWDEQLSFDPVVFFGQS